MAKTNQAQIAEFFSPATVLGLNAALRERGLDVSQVISIFVIPGTTLLDPSQEQFRVLYRT